MQTAVPVVSGKGTRMKGRMLYSLAMALAALALVAATLFAHSGGLDSRGGHRNRRTGEYHYHRGPAAGSGSTTRARDTQGLMSAPSSGLGQASLSSSLRRFSTEQKVDALIAALQRRGVVTEAELLRELESNP